MKKNLIILFLTVMICSNVFSQSCTTTIGTISACPADTILIPVNGTGFTNIAAITLYIGYNSSILNFVGLANVQASLSGIMSNSMTSPSVEVGVIWSSLSPSNFGTGKLFDMKFVYYGGNCTLSVNNDSEIDNANLITLTLTGQSGSISQNQTPVINTQPQTISVKVGDVANFSVSASGAASYQWMVSNDGGTSWTNVQNVSPYSNATGTSLHVTNVQFIMNNRKFRCKATGTCSILSNPATLIVDTTTGINENSNDHEFSLKQNFPNPCKDVTEYKYSIPANGFVVTDVIDMFGRTLFHSGEYQEQGNHMIKIDCSQFQNGIYYFRIQYSNDSDKRTLSEKLMVNR